MQFLYLACVFNTHSLVSPEFPGRNTIKEKFVETTLDLVVLEVPFKGEVGCFWKEEVKE